MAELADSVLLSRSGLTRLVDRLQAAGLVVREPFPGDARGMYTVLTPAGLDRLRRAAPIHLAGVQEYWLSKFSDDELRQLHDLLNRLVADSEDSDINGRREDEASSAGRDQLRDRPRRLVVRVASAVEPAELRSQEVARHDLPKREPDSRQFAGDVVQVGR
mgnify:CR=1 FL=1